MSTGLTSESLIARLRRLNGAACAGCRDGLCYHQVLVSIYLGLADAPRCPRCLAAALGRSPVALRDEVVAALLRRDCYARAWAWATQEEAGGQEPSPTCPAVAHPRAGETPALADPEPAPTPPPVSGLPTGLGLAATPAGQWDAGDLGCGELVLELRHRLERLPPAAVFQLTARDAGAREDLPAWCRLMGHRLVRADHPVYWIARRDTARAQASEADQAR